MGHPRRRYEHQAVFFVTNRLAEGLPFVPNDFINNLILGILSLAQEKCSDVAICALIFMQNHYHLVLVPEGDPARVKDFMNIFNGELAKAICKLLGKKHVKVWAQRYHAAQILTADDCYRELAYLYANPCAASFVDTIKDWPGVNTWQAAIQDNETYIPDTYKYIRPKFITKLPNKQFTFSEIDDLKTAIDRVPGRKRSVTFKPYAWKHAFKDTSAASNNTLKERLLTAVCSLERQHTKTRTSSDKLSNLKRLSLQNPYKHYKPKKFGIRVFCISSCLELRKTFIALYKDFCEKCSLAWEQFKIGNFNVSFPPGAYPPPLIPKASIYNIDH